MKVIGLLAAVALLIVPVSQAGTEANVISRLSFGPNPLYDDDFAMHVSFKASRPARAGYEWVVVFSISGAEQIGACSSTMISFMPDFGGSRKIHRKAGENTVFLRANRYGGRFCRGRGTIFVSEHRIGSESFGRPLGPGSTLFNIRVLRS